VSGGVAIDLGYSDQYDDGEISLDELADHLLRIEDQQDAERTVRARHGATPNGQDRTKDPETACSAALSGTRRHHIRCGPGMASGPCRSRGRICRSPLATVGFRRALFGLDVHPPGCRSFGSAQSGRSNPPPATENPTGHRPGGFLSWSWEGGRVQRASNAAAPELLEE